jgi:hypothetical protein
MPLSVESVALNDAPSLACVDPALKALEGITDVWPKLLIPPLVRIVALALSCPPCQSVWSITGLLPLSCLLDLKGLDFPLDCFLTHSPSMTLS